MRTRPVVAALAVVVALVGGSYAAKQLLTGNAATPATPASTSLCPLNALSWKGHITGPRVTPSAPKKEAAIVRGINTFRSAHGLRPLRSDAALAYAARAHSQQMLRLGYFAHDGPNEGFVHRLGRYSPRSCIAENIAWGNGEFGTAGGVVQSWKESPGHRRIMLLPWTRRVGVGVAVGVFQDTAAASVVTADFAG